MTDRLINLRDWEAAALAEGRATALVRVCKPQPPAAETIRKMAGIDYGLINPKQGLTWRVSGPVWAVRDVMGIEPEFRCPFGAPGDVILGRENYWRFTGCDSAGKPWEGFTESPDVNPFKAVCYYDYPQMGAARMACAALKMPSVTMPRWAIRARYTNAGVRCMRVQDLTEQDAKELGAVSRTYRDGRGFEPARIDYKTRFNSDQGPGAWAANPLVFIARLTK